MESSVKPITAKKFLAHAHKKHHPSPVHNNSLKEVYVVYDDNGIIHAISKSVEVAEAIVRMDSETGKFDLENPKIEKFRLYDSTREI